MIKIKLLAAIAASALALPAAALTQAPGVDKQLTPKETVKLEKGQDKVAAKEAKAKSDGKVVKKERKKTAREKQAKRVTAPAN